jgi:hypothetical protein
MSSSINLVHLRLTRRQFGGGLATWLVGARNAHPQAWQRPVRFGVFSLFEPRKITLKPDTPLLVNIDEGRYLVSPDSPAVLICLEDRDLNVTIGAFSWTASHLWATSPAGGAASFLLEVPPSLRHGSISRSFHGNFETRAAGERLQLIVAMALEVAVASIVSAESSPSAPLAFLMAQAIASRSFLAAARGVHTGFDFCDTTHCQYLRGPSPAGSAPGLAAAYTAGLCLNFDGHPLAAMYSRSCSGRTCSLSELGLPSRGYPYYPVDCEYCRRYPDTWERHWNRLEQPLPERERIAFNRIHGWSAIPSGGFIEKQGRLEGRGVGHGLGLCQRGAEAMAKAGSGCGEILAHYYPNTEIAFT